MSSFDAWEKTGGGGATGDIPIYSLATLPAPDGTVRIAKLTDGNRGLVFSNGLTWASVAGLDVYVMEDFGARGDAGITDNITAWNAIMAVIGKSQGYGVQSGTCGAIIRFANTHGNVYNFLTTPKLTVPYTIVEGSGGSLGASRTVITGPIGNNLFVVGDLSDDGGWGGGGWIRHIGFSGAGYTAGGTPSYNSLVPPWAATTAVTVGQLYQPKLTAHNNPITAQSNSFGGYLWRCTVAGTTGSSEPAWPICNTPDTFTEDNPTVSGDGGVTWVGVQGHGFVMHAGITLEGCSVAGVFGDGFHLWGDTTHSNTDLSLMIDCSANFCNGNGFSVRGTDAGPSKFLKCRASQCGLYGFFDSAANANNSFDTCETSSNGSYNWEPGASNFSVGQTFAPSTPNGYQYEADVIVSAFGMTEPTWPTSIGDTVVSGGVTLTCVRLWDGGSYYMRYGHMLACYAESDQIPGYLGDGAQCIGSNTFSARASSQGFLQIGNIANRFTVSTKNVDATYDLVTEVGGAGSARLVAAKYDLTTKATNLPYTPSNFALAYKLSGDTAKGLFFEGGAGTPSFGIADGTEAGTAQGDAQFPAGMWIGGPAAPGGGSFVSLHGDATTPTDAAQLGDIKYRVGSARGPSLWQYLGSPYGGWTVVGEGNGAAIKSLSAYGVFPSQYDVVEADHNILFTNEGASTLVEVLLLDAASCPGLRVKIRVVDALGMIIETVGSDFIRLGALQTTATSGVGNLKSVVPGSTLTLEAIASGQWFVTDITGSWNLDNETAAQPNVETLLSSTTIDTNLSTKQALYTVPAGVTCVPTKLIARSVATVIAVPTNWTFGWDSGCTNVSSTAQVVDAIGSYSVTTPNGTGTPGSAFPVMGVATNVLGLKMAATQVGSIVIDTFGYLF